jgi:hypothetical protein
VIIGFPITFLTILGFAYIDALALIENPLTNNYREDCKANNFLNGGGDYFVLCDIRDQNEKLIEQNKQIIIEEQKQTVLLDHIDCYTEFYFTMQKHEQCGDPLNITGVWTP